VAVRVDAVSAPVVTLVERDGVWADPLLLKVMAVAGMYGVDPPELLDWHARVEHDAVGPASPYNHAFARALDNAGRCFTDEVFAQARHRLPCAALIVAAQRHHRLRGAR
jgi:hypothetical protein